MNRHRFVICSPAEPRCSIWSPLSKPGSRRGAITTIVLVILLLISGMIATMVRRVIIERRSLRNEIDYLQAEKLADAGLTLATQHLNQNPEWRGLRREFSQGLIHQTKSGELQIIISEQKEMTVTARYPTNVKIPFQVTRTRKIEP
ncbi:MAG: hypothetical protein ACK526_19270 [Planctomyces sp.]|jgi:Tfp pilus assembly protein PilX